MDEAELSGLLAAKFSLPHWAFLRSVRNSTGFPATLRTADAMAMYKAFRGREPSVEPLLEKRGLKN